ncbi:Bardet-Biedl syndrome 7 protein [Podochytrium sp. JEL0797]|nr:Bardet-Biedl syndrome 7 protein [Podochytrium sp. JEL0797]
MQDGTSDINILYGCVDEFAMRLLDAHTESAVFAFSRNSVFGSRRVEPTNSLKLVTDTPLATLHHWVHLTLPDVPERVPTTTPIIYLFESTSSSSRVQCTLEKGTLRLATTSLITLHHLKTHLTHLSNLYQTKISQSTRIDLPTSLDTHLSRLFTKLESQVKMDREKMLLEGLREVEAHAGASGMEVFEDGLLRILENGGNAGEMDVDVVAKEMGDLFVASWALRGVEVGKKRGWVEEFVKEGVKQGRCDLELLRRMLNDERVLQ